MTLKFVHVSDHEVVLRKPAGLLSEAPRTSTADNVLSRLRAEGMGDVRLVHRLDKPACGLMLVARTLEAAAYYNAEIAARRWHKVYVAKVACRPDVVRSLVGDHRAYLKTEGKRAAIVRAGGKPSFLTIAHAAPTDDGAAFVLIRLHTGRFHQIRVMLANLGAPLVGDELYGEKRTSEVVDLRGRFYLEHVLLAARPLGANYLHVWQSPADDDRPQWPASLTDAVAAEVVRISAP